MGDARPPEVRDSNAPREDVRFSGEANISFLGNPDSTVTDGGMGVHTQLKFQDCHYDSCAFGGIDYKRLWLHPKLSINETLADFLSVIWGDETRTLITKDGDGHRAFYIGLDSYSGIGWGRLQLGGATSHLGGKDYLYGSTTWNGVVFDQGYRVSLNYSPANRFGVSVFGGLDYPSFYADVSKKEKGRWRSATNYMAFEVGASFSLLDDSITPGKGTKLTWFDISKRLLLDKATLALNRYYGLKWSESIEDAQTFLTDRGYGTTPSPDSTQDTEDVRVFNTMVFLKYPLGISKGINFFLRAKDYAPAYKAVGLDPIQWIDLATDLGTGATAFATGGTADGVADVHAFKAKILYATGLDLVAVNWIRIVTGGLGMVISDFAGNDGSVQGNAGEVVSVGMSPNPGDIAADTATSFGLSIFSLSTSDDTTRRGGISLKTEIGRHVILPNIIDGRFTFSARIATHAMSVMNIGRRLENNLGSDTPKYTYIGYSSVGGGGGYELQFKDPNCDWFTFALGFGALASYNIGRDKTTSFGLMLDPSFIFMFTKKVGAYINAPLLGEISRTFKALEFFPVVGLRLVGF